MPVHKSRHLDAILYQKTKENYEERLTQLINLSSNGISGESSKASQKVVTYLEAISGDNKAANINFINQTT